MTDPHKPREGYGGMSEERERGVTNSTFEERTPHTPEEMDAARAGPDKAHKVEYINVAARDVEVPVDDEGS
ncbi:MAG: hypothetical protein L0Y66_14150 [Myxococcaceae bacterium]|nr:hypothetical protein [Myxococcaceae bacterium]MCI0673624.1 hypothetical protein [Myxococcaceae bacterium]